MSESAEQVVWFRYIDGRWAPPLDEWDRPCGDSNPYIFLLRLPVVKTTPCGVWITDEIGRRRFVLRDARKRYACPTQAEALSSFQARKERQKRILTAQLRAVEGCLSLAVAEWAKVTPAIHGED